MFNKKSLIASLAVFATTTLSWGTFYQSGIGGEITSIDFSMATSASGHSNWGTWTVNSSSGTKYMSLQLAGESSGGNKSCFDVIFYPETGSSSNTDLQVFSSGGASIDDDGPSGNRLPRFRYWGSTTIYVNISAYSSSYNDVDFRFQIFRTLAASKNDCETGSDYPTVDDGGSISNQNSTSN
jgi:hypothetical protein